jgi:hypothetical protein
MEKALVLTGPETQLLSRTLEEVKAKTFEKSETRLNDFEALEILTNISKFVEQTPLSRDDNR